MADVAINKRTVLVKNPASQQDFPGSTAPPVISPDVEVNFLELVDTPDTYTGQDGKFVRVKSTEDGLEFADVSGGGDTVTGDETRGIEVTEPTAGNKVVAKKYYNVFLPFTSTMTLELKEGRRHIFTATSDFVLANPSNILSFEGRVEIVITQGLGGGHQISSVGDRVIFPNGTIPTLNGTFGESDWLRGTVVNGYLLIYQIESLAAPGIDVEPPPAPPASVTYLAQYGFLQFNSTITSPSEYSRSQDDVADNMPFLQGTGNFDSVHSHLAASTPISAFGEFLNTDIVLKDQSGNGEDLIASSTYAAELKASRNQGYFYICERTRAGILSTSDQAFVSGIGTCTISALVRLTGSGAGGYVARLGQGSSAVTYFQLGENSNNWQLSARINSVDSFVTISGSAIEEGKWYILQAVGNFAGNIVELKIDGVSSGTANPVSTGNIQTNSANRFDAINDNNLEVAYLSVISSAVASDVIEEEQYIRAAYNEFLSNDLVTGSKVIKFMELVLSPDRYNYSPYAANIRRTTDNVEAIISHDANTGYFNTTQFDAHVGIGDGFISVLTQQQNPFFGFQQATAARQLKLVKNVFGSRVGMQGSNSARRSIQRGFSLNTKALHYYFFIPVVIDTRTSRVALFTLLQSGQVIIYGGFNLQSLNYRLEVVQRINSSDSFRQTISSTGNFLTATPYLCTFHFDYENGIMNGWVNQELIINDTGAKSALEIGAVDTFTIANSVDNGTLGFDGKIGGCFFSQKEMTSAQRIAIETELMNTYGIS